MAGIAGYGAYVPVYRIKIKDIAEAWGKDASIIENGLLIKEKSVGSIDEDAATIAVEAAINALKRACIKANEIEAIYVGSESHPYAVKPTSTIVGDAIGVGNKYTGADTEFACKAGTAAMQMCFGLVSSGIIKYGLAIGSDTAQAAPGDALEFSAASGGAAFIIGKDNVLAELVDTVSYSSDTPDFWRRQHAVYPRHGGRFTGEPAYFRHVIGATNLILEKTGFKISDFDYFVFHMPNGKFPLSVAKKFGIPSEKIQDGFVVSKIGNTYSGSSMLGLASVLDVADAGKRILVTSYGSGAGSDSFIFETTELLQERRKLAPFVSEYIERKKYISYSEYLKMRKKMLL